MLSCYPFLDHSAGRRPASAGNGGPCAADRLSGNIDVLLPMALCGAPRCSLYAKPRIFESRRRGS